MTALTPQQMRELADEGLQYVDEDRYPGGPLVGELSVALRSSADEVDRLRAEADDVYRDAYRLGRQHSGAEVHKQRAAELRAAIENAPHAANCAYATDGFPSGYCTCWKADAL